MGYLYGRQKCEPKEFWTGNRLQIDVPDVGNIDEKRPSSPLTTAVFLYLNQSGTRSTFRHATSITSQPKKRIAHRGDDYADNIRRSFAPTLNAFQIKVLEKTFRALIDAFRKANVSYHMCGGMLIGSYFHHGMVPWDDDLDVCVLVSEIPRLLRALNSTIPEYTYVRPYWQHNIYKFFSGNESTPVGRKSFDHYRIPFVDICLYAEDNETIWDLVRGGKEGNVKRFKKSLVFPLGRRPFLNLTISAPRQSLAYIQQNFDTNVCATIGWSHVNETEPMRKQIFVPCEPLYSIYPFVFRQKLANGTIETLRIGNQTLSSVFVDEFDSL